MQPDGFLIEEKKESSPSSGNATKDATQHPRDQDE